MTDETNYEGVAAYSSDEEEEIIPEIDDENKQAKRNDTYSTIHSSGFKDFLLKSALVRAIIDCAFEHPSEVQNQCLPSAITGSDILCQAQSGMGKTAVFVLAVLQQMEENPEGVRCLVLCHARELAYQICHEFDRFTKYMPNIKTAVFYGGIQYDENVEIIKNENPNIVVGTPGRILQLVKSKDLNLTRCKFFVLDECDKMLEKTDMRSDVQSIFRDTPHEKQVMMFSATLSEAVRPVCRKFMHKPLEIIINDGSKLTLHGLKQYYVQLDEGAKTKQLIKLLDDLEFNQCIIFVRTVRRATELNAILVELKFPSICIHGGREMTQEERIRRYKKFKEFRVRIMVATNLFGRGIDIERVNVVINYDMSEDYETYLHRVGRAGRFGTNGLAISFISSKEDADVLNSVQKVFVVNVPKLPDVIDPTTYMNS